MNFKTFLGLAAVAVLAISTFNLTANTSLSAAPQDEAQAAGSVEIARLVVTAGGDRTTWFVGGTNATPREESIRETYRKLGGKMKPNMSNLLDQIGSRNWRFVQKDGETWIFTRGGAN